MNVSGTVSAPFLRSDLPPNINVLTAQPTSKVKLQEEEHKYIPYTRAATNGSAQIQWIDVEASFVLASFFKNTKL
eukprot:15366615-Ditylum_brightwellii.AAC.1